MIVNKDNKDKQFLNNNVIISSALLMHSCINYTFNMTKFYQFLLLLVIVVLAAAIPDGN